MRQKLGYENLDRPRERFFGWFPYLRAQKVIFILTILLIIFGAGVTPYLPTFWVFYIIPSVFVWAGVVTVALGQFMWTVYFSKYWTAWEDENLDNQ